MKERFHRTLLWFRNFRVRGKEGRRQVRGREL